MEESVDQFLFILSGAVLLGLSTSAETVCCARSYPFGYMVGMMAWSNELVLYTGSTWQITHVSCVLGKFWKSGKITLIGWMCCFLGHGMLMLMDRVAGHFSVLSDASVSPTTAWDWVQVSGLFPVSQSLKQHAAQNRICHRVSCLRAKI